LKCDSTGHCTCITVASIGKPAHYGGSTDAFQSWLNTKSSATVDLITTHTAPLTKDLLDQYQVIILQALEDGEQGPFWQFTAAEVAAVSEWVQNGGGLITLTGYGSDPGEVNPTNQLLQFTGISYNKDNVLITCPNSLCYCWSDSIPLAGWQAASPISANITQVGAKSGRSINAGDATVVSTDGTYVYGAAKAVGKGKVFVFTDEWVTYTSQWLGVARTVNQYDPCYDPVTMQMKTADKYFQVPQFWYNAIKWVSSSTCDFVIEDPGIVP
jgi:hypothetical protein